MADRHALNGAEEGDMAFLAGAALGDVKNVGHRGALGFRRHVPQNWNKWWVAVWFVVPFPLILSAFHLPFWAWISLAIVFFLVPEMISLIKKNDDLPPLTHTIRHFLPDWIAFPLIYFSLGSVGAHWLRFHNTLGIGALMGLLGWLTDHFVVTYAASDPFPYLHRASRPGTERQRLPG
jgi:hypothetical protein